MKRDYLIQMRAQRGESQQDVANALGITRQYYGYIEDGSRQKRMDIMLAGLISVHFGVSVSEIFDFEKALSDSG